MSTSLDFQALLAGLSAKRDNPNAPSGYPRPGAEWGPGYGNSSVVSQLPERPSSSIVPEGNAGNNAAAQGLLSLLNRKTEASKENTQPRGEALQRPASETIAQASAMSASDLVAKFMSGAPRGESVNRLLFNGARDDSASEKVDAPTPSASQDALLRLLNRSSSSGARSGMSGSADNKIPSPLPMVNEKSGSATPSVKSTRAPSEPRERRDSPIRFFGTTQSRETTPFEAPKMEEAPKENETKPLFTYKNPFEALNASRNQTPKPQTPSAQSSTPIVKTEPKTSTSQVRNTSAKERHLFDMSPNPTSTRRKLTPKVPGRSSSMVYESIERDPTDVVVPIQPSKQPTNKPDFSNGQPEDRKLSPTADVPIASQQKVHTKPKRSGSPLDQLTVLAETKAPKNETFDNADAWESEDDPIVKISTNREVPVYNFPIKPFVSIVLQPGPSSPVNVREDGIMEISRLKKEFDQIDRSLASATSKYISYALVKNGGIRIIRQDDGTDRQVFKNSGDRIFNVTFCSTALTAPPSNDQAVLGTGVSGSVYYATVSKEGSDLFEENMLETESLIFPPFPMGDENTSGGALKTRAKRSSRHPEFFGIGRGKNIYIIWPATALSSKYGISATSRKVDVEKLYKERALRITTGKAGKDFIFSEDDSLIVSLDKTGRMRFWDIRLLVHEETATAPKVSPINVDSPLLTLSIASPSEKSWPTSVLFVDKIRPYAKGGALRYILVGLRQNHTLQLWDIALGKAVQELNFSHDSESDGVCSVNYHPNSGIIVVGHPTRNSIYFIHLSAPRYNLKPWSQATYTQMIADQDLDIPKPESTACMSGLREISFADKGHLRSVELLPIYKASDASKASSQTQGLFELYVVHSRGVTCLNITKDDLGWNAENKVLKPVDAAAEGFITLKELKLGSFVNESAEAKSQSEEPVQAPKSSKKKSPSKVTRSFEESQKAELEGSQGQETQVLTNGSAPTDLLPREILLPKETKKSKKKKEAVSSNDITQLLSRGNSPTKQAPKEGKPEQDPSQLSSDMASMNLSPKQESVGPSVEASSKSGPAIAGVSGDWLGKELKKIENGVSGEFRKELNNLYQTLQNDRNVQDSANVARQEAVLRLVSTTLSTNIEKSLSRMISAQMQQIVVPAITGVAVQAVTSQVGEAVARVLHQLVPHELATQMPVAINAALQNPQISRTIADAVSHKISGQIEAQVTDALHKSIMPSFKNLTISTADKVTADIEKRMGAQVRQLEADRRADIAKIDKLSQVMQGMAETMQAMSESQVAFQGQILKDRKQLSQFSESNPASASRQVSTAYQASSPAPPPVPQFASGNNTKTPEENEFDDINKLMNEGRYEEGSIKWLQSTQPIELFDDLFVRFTPEYLETDVSPLVAFSIAITVANSLSTNTASRIEWISTAFNAVNVNDPEIADLSEHAPALLSSLIQKLENIEQRVAGDRTGSGIHQTVSELAGRAKHMRAELLGHGHGHERMSAGYNYNYGQLDA